MCAVDHRKQTTALIRAVTLRLIGAAAEGKNSRRVLQVILSRASHQTISYLGPFVFREGLTSFVKVLHFYIKMDEDGCIFQIQISQREAQKVCDQNDTTVHLFNPYLIMQFHSF